MGLKTQNTKSFFKAILRSKMLTITMVMVAMIYSIINTILLYLHR